MGNKKFKFDFQLFKNWKFWIAPAIFVLVIIVIIALNQKWLGFGYHLIQPHYLWQNYKGLTTGLLIGSFLIVALVAVLYYFYSTDSRVNDKKDKRKIIIYVLTGLLVVWIIFPVVTNFMGNNKSIENVLADKVESPTPAVRDEETEEPNTTPGEKTGTESTTNDQNDKPGVELDHVDSIKIMEDRLDSIAAKISAQKKANDELARKKAEECTKYARLNRRIDSLALVFVKVQEEGKQIAQTDCGPTLPPAASIDPPKRKPKKASTRNKWTARNSMCTTQGNGFKTKISKDPIIFDH